MDPEKLSAQTEYSYAHLFFPNQHLRGFSNAAIHGEQMNTILTARDVETALEKLKNSSSEITNTNLLPSSDKDLLE